MQGRRTIYYPGNTVEAPHPSEKNRRKRELLAKAPNVDPTKIMADEPKICCTSQCVWCGVDFEGFKAICNRCTCCQYCGCVSYNAVRCHTCNNELPDDMKPPTTIRRIVVA